MSDAQAPDPVFEGDAVLPVEIVGLSASGGRGWELRAVHIGRSHISVAGREPFQVTIRVMPADSP